MMNENKRNIGEEEIQYGSVKLEDNQILVGTDYFGNLRVIGKTVATGVQSEAYLEKKKAEEEEQRLIEESKMYVQIIDNRMYLTIAYGDEFSDFEIAFKPRERRYSGQGPIARLKSALAKLISRILGGGR